MPRGQPFEVGIPTLGTRFDVPAHRVPNLFQAGALSDGKNVIVRHGVLIPRPGLTKLFSTGFGEQVMGGI